MLLFSVHQPYQTEGGLTTTIAELRKLGERRKKYVDDATSWLMRNASVHHATLTKVWGDRAMAIAEAAEDNPRAVIAWQADTAFEHAVAAKDATGLPNGVTSDELLSQRWLSWRSELVSVLSIDATIEGISLANKWLTASGASKLLPPDQLAVYSTRDNTRRQDNQQSLPYKLEILAGDDPRGLTIGPKTGCCMTIHGTAESCIEQGYSDPNAGFLSLQMPDGKLGAQSFWYINPRQPHILVLDNIEANSGRDMGNVIQLYKDGLAAYLTGHPETGIIEVHVGEGYSDANLSHLPGVEPVPNPDSRVYTDVRRQRLLLRLPN